MASPVGWLASCTDSICYLFLYHCCYQLLSLPTSTQCYCLPPTITTLYAPRISNTTLTTRPPYQRDPSCIYYIFLNFNTFLSIMQPATEAARRRSPIILFKFLLASYLSSILCYVLATSHYDTALATHYWHGCILASQILPQWAKKGTYKKITAQLIIENNYLILEL